MTYISLLKDSIKVPRINYWKVVAGIGLLQLAVNAITWYENSAIANPALRARFLNWQFSWLYLTQQLVSLILVSCFCFVVFNVVYQLTVRKTAALPFLATLLPLLGLMLLLDISINYFFYKETYHLLLTSPWVYLSDFLFGTTVLSIATLIIVKVAITNDIASRNRELEFKNTKLELDKRKAEMDLMKAQVNPHFLYNSLNYLYSKSLPHSKELSDGILLLSEIMKYAFHNPNMTEDGLVQLPDEVGYIRKYLTMVTLRFGASFNVSFEQEGTISHVRIIPFALFTMVENAVKHADATDPNHPILIRLQVTGQALAFSCANNKKPGHALKDTTQIGIANLTGRLTASYGNNYDLQVEDKPDRYFIKLLIYSTNANQGNRS